LALKSARLPLFRAFARFLPFKKGGAEVKNAADFKELKGKRAKTKKRYFSAKQRQFFEKSA
jgi:hypothetical protein